MKPGEKKYPHIFQPGQIGRFEVKNRIKFAATETNFNDRRDGFISDKEVAWMEQVSRGGAGIVTAQGAYTDPKGEGKGYVGMAAIYDDKFIPGWKRIADVIHKYGGLAVFQLMHCGRVGGIELDYTVGPSPVPQRLPRFRPPREMTKEDIRTEVQRHVDGARRAIEAGFDSVEISGIVGYLISNFLSGYTNVRTDEYGGSLENRCRFMVEIIQGIRKEIGKDYPIMVRLCADELLEDRGGNTPEESVQTILAAERAGVDLVSVTAGWQESAYSVITRDIPQGHWLYLGERVKKAVKIPVSMAYRLFKPEIAEKAIADGKIDYWESCRPMIADPLKPLKILEGREEDVNNCMACNLCLARLFRDQPIVCLVDPMLGHWEDPDWQLTKAKEKKRIAVVGGGPGGMYAAFIAAQRGHDVTLYEKNDHLGGQLSIAAKGPYGDEEFQYFINYLETQCRKAGVKIELNREITSRDFSDPLHAPDAVVLATGAEVRRPDTAGADRPNVFVSHEVMLGKAQIGEKIAIIGGEGQGISTALYLLTRGGVAAEMQAEGEAEAGAAAALYLLDKGKQVSIIDPGKKLGRDVNPSYIWRYIKKLKEGHVTMYTQCKILEINDEGVVIKGPDGQQTVVLADTVVIAGPRQARKELIEPMEYAVAELHVIGDASTPRRGHNATAEGFRIGLKI